MRLSERRERDGRVLDLFLQGCSYREIAARVGLRSPQSVGNIVKRELGSGEGRRALITELAGAIYLERSEALFKMVWPAAMEGDYRATEICLRELDARARFHGLY